MKTLNSKIGKLLLMLVILGIGTNLQAQQNPTRSDVGNMKKIQIDNYFDRIMVSGGVNIVLRQADSTSIYCDGKSGAESIKFDCKDSCIFINRGKNNDKSNNSIVFVTMPVVKSIKSTSASDIESDGTISGDELALFASGASYMKLDLDVKSLFVETNGASDVILSGKCGVVLANASGASDLQFSDLSSRITMVNSSGASDANIGSSDNVFYSKSGISSVSIENGDGILSNTTISLSNILNKLDGENCQIIINDLPLEIYFQKDSLSGGLELMADIDRSEEFFSRLKEGSKTWSTTVDLSFDDDDTFDDEDLSFFHEVDANWAGVETGLNMLLNKDFNNIYEGDQAYLELNQSRSWCFNWNIVDYGLSIGKNSSWTIFTGVGLSWYNFRFANPTYLTKADYALQGYLMKDGSVSKTKLTSFYAQIPLMIEWAPSDFFVSAGVTGGVRLSSHTKTVVGGDPEDIIFQNMNGDVVEVENILMNGKNKSFGDFYQNLFKLDASLRVGYDDWSLFANYSLIPLFVEGKGPEVYPFTFGLSLNF